MLKQNDKIAIVCCSNPQPASNREKIGELIDTLISLELSPILSKYIFEDSYGNGFDRGMALMDFYINNDIKAIFDISGGDLSNEVLEYLDFDIIQKNNKPFFGYSDVTTIVNAIYSKTTNKAYLYQIRNLISKDKFEQINNFKSTILGKNEDLYKFKYDFIQGNGMEGIVVGGNIRCLLKLAGTEYIPDFNNKILFLESMSGKVPQMITFLTQLKQIGALKKLNGIILGTFTEMEKEGCKPTIEELVLSIVDDLEIPIVKTSEIGHGTDSKCIIIGGYYKFE